MAETTDEDDEYRNSSGGDSGVDAADSGASNKAIRCDISLHYHRDLELTRLCYKLARIDTQRRHIDHGIPFRRFAMEKIPSFLAEQLTEKRPPFAYRQGPW